MSEYRYKITQKSHDSLPIITGGRYDYGYQKYVKAIGIHLDEHLGIFNRALVAMQIVSFQQKTQIKKK